VRTGLCLPSLPFDGVALSAKREQFSFLMQALRFLGQVFFE
jgi:hypothetical protein